jgi:hypothetical protein
MRPIRFAALLVVAGAGACATHEPPPVVEAPPTAVAPPPAPEHPWPGGDRADLVVPDELWSRALDRLGRTGGRLGYSAEEMSLYKNDRFALRTVTNLFRDVRTIPRFSGAQAKALVADAKSPALVVERAFGWTDVRAGRMLPMPTADDGWGVDWIPKTATPLQAIDAILARPAGKRAPAAAPADRAWFDAVVAKRSDLRPADVLCRLATAPYSDDRRGQDATLSKASFEALTRIDREYLAFGSVIFASYVSAAIDEYRAATGDVSNAVGCVISTALGKIRVYGAGADAIPDAAADDAFLTIDLGGDDRYAGRQGVPLDFDSPIGIVVDLGGNDVYDGGDAPCSIACGLFGVGAVFDVGGNDRYRVKESGLGCGWFGTGLLVDSAGNDEYVVDTHWGEACAHVGAGVLVDLEGNDSYTCGFDSQAHAGTLGAAVLLDVAGDDHYLARDDGNVSEMYLGQSVAMSQGAAQGRRADLGDGHSMAGGVAFLVDGAGNDEYHATAWSQGCGYWWAAGFLEDLGGDDTYRNGKYSSGAGAHFAIGCQVDLSGDDRYNVGNDATKNQYQGHARDGSVGVSIDGDGNDAYKLTTLCGGASDLTSIAVLWDRRGDDVYEIAWTAPEKADGWTDTPPLGGSSLYPRSNEFRDDVDAFGLFLDTGGTDRYVGPEIGAGDGREWASHRGPRSWGYGLDVEWYPRAPSRP